MKSLSPVAALLIGALSFPAQSADSNVEPLTKLAFPSAGAPITFYNDPNRMDDVPVCKSSAIMVLYTARTGTVSEAVAWYTSHLPGFKHIHGMGSGRSQDAFYNSDGTLVVSITGEPGPEGQDPKVGSVLYGAIKPGVSDKVMAGLNSQKLVCP
jgi:hypothetical protein